jgi:hypothetical protein
MKIDRSGRRGLPYGFDRSGHGLDSCRRGRRLDGFATRREKLFQVLAAGGSERVIGIEGRGRDLHRTAITPFRLVRLVSDLADDGEVVECIGEVRVLGTEARLLQAGGLAQQPLRRRVMAGSGGLLRLFDDGSRIPRVQYGSVKAHSLYGSASRKYRRLEDVRIARVKIVSGDERPALWSANRA